MTFIQEALLRIFVWLGFIQKPELTMKLVSDHPASDALEPGCIYVVDVKGHRKWAYFRCPAKVDEIIQLSLMAKRRPHWEIKTDWLGRPTIHPSVRQLEGSFAHFWVKRGRIDWCSDTGRQPNLLH